MVLLLFDFEKIVVVAALLAIVLGDHVHAFDGARRDQGDAFDIFIEPLFQITHPGFDVLSLGLGDLEELILLLERRRGP